MIALKQFDDLRELRASAWSRRACRTRLHLFCGSSVLGPQLWRDCCLITVRERVDFLARILGRDGIIDRDRFGARGGKFERVGRG